MNDRPLTQIYTKEINSDIGKTWYFCVWSDGTHQWQYSEPGLGDINIFIERVLLPGRDKKNKPLREYWHHVARNNAGNALYPPIIAGPFRSFAAVKAYVMLTKGVSHAHKEE